MTDAERMHQIDQTLSHIWMVRTFIKHSEEAEEDEDLRDVHRGLYDYMLALGEPLSRGDAGGYLRQARKKLGKLRQATELYEETQPEISSHTNFQMARVSLRRAVDEITALLELGD